MKLLGALGSLLFFMQSVLYAQTNLTGFWKFSVPSERACAFGAIFSATLYFHSVQLYAMWKSIVTICKSMAYSASCEVCRILPLSDNVSKSGHRTR